MEQKIISSYIPGQTTLREVAKICNTNHKLVSRVLKRNNIEIKKGKIVITEKMREARIKNGLKNKGKTPWNKGKKMSTITNYKNMASHLKHDINFERLMEFENIEKLKVLNQMVRQDRITFDKDTYLKYIEKFYHDKNFNKIYDIWIKNDKNSWYKPSIDHIIPKSKNGNNDLDNFQVLTWFENKCKCNINNEIWIEMKKNINELFI